MKELKHAGLKVAIIFILTIELCIVNISRTHKYDISRLEIIKIISYLMCFFKLNIYLKIKKTNSKIVDLLNGAVGGIISSLSGGIFITLFLNYEKMDWIYFLACYLASILLCIYMGSKATVMEENTQGKSCVAGKIVLGLFFYPIIYFSHNASGDSKEIFLVCGIIVLTWLLLFASMILFIGVRHELKNNHHIQGR